MSAAERFAGASREAFEKSAKGIVLKSATQPERELQGVCHELLEIIEGQEYIIEDAQFAINYGLAGPVMSGSRASFELTARDMIQGMQEVKATAEELYDNTFNCRRARERAGFEVER